MKTPTTKQARNLIKLAIEITGSKYQGSWTDKTSEKDPTRRSVSFMISTFNAFAVLTTLQKIYKDLGYTSPVKLTHSEEDWSNRSGGYTYIRAIAVLDK